MQFKKLSFALLSSLFIGFVSVSCDNEASDFGLGVLPAEEMIKVKIIDSINVPFNQILFDEEYLLRSDQILLGIAKDSVFGDISASLLTQLSTFENPVDLKKLTIDSLESFILHVVPDTAIQGDRTSKVIIDVYPLTKALSAKIYYNYTFQGNDYIDKSKSPIATFELDAAKIKSGFDIPLSREYAKLFFECNLNSVKGIDTVLHGLCFIPRAYTNRGLIASINFGYNSGYYPGSYLRLKYKTEIKKDSIVSDSVIFSLASNIPVSASAKYYLLAKANPIKYDYKKSTKPTFLSGDLSDSLLYISSRGGAKVVYNLSYLDSFPKIHNSAISKAELIIPIEDNYWVKNQVNHTYSSGLKVIFAGVNIREYPSYGAFFSNVNDESSVFDTKLNAYKVDITSFVESYIGGDVNFKELIVSINSISLLQKAILNKNKKPTLKIKYTTF